MVLEIASCIGNAFENYMKSAILMINMLVVSNESWYGKILLGCNGVFHSAIIVHQKENEIALFILGFGK